VLVGKLSDDPILSGSRTTSTGFLLRRSTFTGRTAENGFFDDAVPAASHHDEIAVPLLRLSQNFIDRISFPDKNLVDDKLLVLDLLELFQDFLNLEVLPFFADQGRPGLGPPATMKPRMIMDNPPSIKRMICSAMRRWRFHCSMAGAMRKPPRKRKIVLLK